MMRWLVISITLLLPLSGKAFTTSERAFRLEDSGRGNVVVGAEQATLEKGEIYHNIVLLWGRLDVYGQVDQVLVLSGHVTFHEGAKLQDSLVVMGGTFESLPGADLKSENVITRAPSWAWRLLRSAASFWRDNIDWMVRLLAGLISSLFFWGIGWALFRAFPALQATTADSLFRHWPRNLLLGFLGSIGACVIFVLLLISVIGIVLIPLYFLLLACAAVLSYIAAGLWAGHRILPPKPGKKLNPFGFLLGLLALQLLWTVPVPWASLPVWLLWTLAWGSIVRSLRLLWR